jgi:tetratricopeptide (TPR) repeat protein
MCTRQSLCFLLLFASLASSAQTQATVPTAGTISVSRLKVSSNARHLFEKAQFALNHGSEAAARKHVDGALALSPDYPDALTLHALLELNAGRNDSALAEVQRALKADPSFGLAYLVMGSVFNRMGRHDEALSSLDREEEVERPSWQCAFEKAKAWLGKQDYERALREVNRASTLGGAAVMPSALHFVRGYALAGLKQYGRAAADLEAYLAEDRDGRFSSIARTTLAQIRTQASLDPIPEMNAK